MIGEGGLVWPTLIKCHGESTLVMSGNSEPDASLHGAWWRPPTKEQTPERQREQTFRTCSYCGSMHPEDLYRHLTSWRAPDLDDVERELSTPKDDLPAIVKDALRDAAIRGPLGGSDWKYGWPHKFYIHGIPNPLGGRDELTYAYSSSAPRLVDVALPGYDIEFLKGGGLRVASGRMKSPTHTFAKFYNQHLLDLPTETLDALAAAIETFSRIRFTRDADGALRYVAPYRGYQS